MASFLEAELESAFKYLVDGGIDDINYILKLLLFKRLSDVFAGEAKAIEKENSKYDSNESTSVKHSFFFPEGCQWVDVKCFEHNIGSQIDEVFNKVEGKNSILQGILISNDSKWERINDRTLQEIIRIVSKFNLQKNHPSINSFLNNACNNLIQKAALRNNQKGGESITPKSIAKLLVGLVEPQENMTICDPVCGVGGLLVECINHIKLKLKFKGCDVNNISLCGQDINPRIYVTAKINLLLHGIYNFDIRLGDTLRSPQFVDNDKLMCFDRIVANPPLNLTNWFGDNYDIYHRFSYGFPPLNSGDFAFFQHIISTLNYNGKACVIASHGALNRSNVAERNIRKNIVQQDLLEAVIGLAPNLIYGSTIPIVILIFNRQKNEERKDKIIFIDASQKHIKDIKKNLLRDKDIEDILSAYQNFQNKEEYARVVSLQELTEDNDVNLNIKKYVKASAPKVYIQAEISKEINKLNELEIESVKLSEEINQYMRALGVNIKQGKE